MIYAFGRYVVNGPQRQLLQDDTWIPTEPKVFDVLLFLIENRERVVSRQELLDNCWPGVHVSDGTLSRCLSRIRQAIGQPRTANEPIQTLHGKGYRFVAEVRSDALRSADEAAAPADETHKADGAPVEPERRFVSVIDCRLAPAVPNRDPEIHHQAVREFFAAAKDIVAGHPCTIAQQSADGLTIHVGYPRAAERPAVVAVLVGHELKDRAAALALEAKITVASGRAIVDSGTAEIPSGQLLVGIDPILRAGHASKVAADELVTDATTAALLEGQLAFTEIGVVPSNGDDHRIYSAKRAEHLDHRRSHAADPPFVGRDWELTFLKERWRKAADGTGQIVLLSGEPGIGKSRLVEELISQTGIPADAALPAHCSPYHQSTPFYSLLALLRHILDVDATTPPLKQLRAIESFLDKIGQPETDHLPLLASLLSVSIPGHRLPPLRLDPERQRERTLEALLFMISSSAMTAPTLLWVDDMQWADTSTLATLERLAPRVSGLPLLLILCFRSGYQVPVPGIDSATKIALDPLGRSQCVRLLTEQSNAGLLPTGSIDEIASRSDGIPLYLREIMRMAAPGEGGQGLYTDNHSIPNTLQGLLASRLDQSGEAKRVAQLGAVIGRSFSRALLGRVAELDESKLDEALSILVNAGLLQEGGRGETLEFSFNHVLIRDAAYESLLLRTRRDYHRRVADIMVNEFPHIATAEPEQIARHYASSDEPTLAAEYWQATGHAMAELDAIDEARSLYGQALDAARSTAATPDTQALIAEIEEMLAEL